jgi:2-keto-4-pentenoate hydratase/2-oxohepta-3-ene-1,7-dioic acid hydratase in catechol pathway
LRIATYFDHAGESHAAFMFEDKLVPASRAARELDLNGTKVNPACARGLLELGQDTVGKLAEAAGSLADGTDSVSVQNVRLAPPVRDPEKFLFAGMNYYSHAAEANLPIESTTTVPLFGKFHNALIAHDDSIVLPGNSDQIDWEGELALVVGTECKDVEESKALEVLAGLTVLNDVSARDLQLSTSQWYAGKGLDTFAPCGPAIVSLDEVDADPNDLGVVTSVNGEVMQDFRTADMVMTVEKVIAYISSLVTLKPGDLIATGTGAGIGFLKDPRRFMTAGDVVSVEIEKVGTLSNPVASS